MIAVNGSNGTIHRPTPGTRPYITVDRNGRSRGVLPASYINIRAKLGRPTCLVSDDNDTNSYHVAEGP